jgi:hypothetical protein
MVLLLGKLTAVLIIVALLFMAALMEVYGDDRIRLGYEGSWSLILIGVATLAGYGLAVNAVNLALKYGLGSEKWTLSKLLGIYVGFFALVSVLWEQRSSHQVEWRRLFASVPRPVWIGLAFIFVGGLIIQWGEKLWNLMRLDQSPK